MRTRVSVTADNIRDGVPETCGLCPVAIALWQATRRDFAVGLQTVMTLRDGIAVGELPLEARDFVARFDRREPVEPFTFEVDLREA